MDKLMWCIISEEAEDSVVDKALSRASEESDYDIGDTKYATISANENDDVPDEYDDTSEDYDDIDITSDILSDIPSNAEIPDYDDVDIAMASDTEEDSAIIDDDDFDEDPNGIEVFYNDNFSPSEPIDNSDENCIYQRFLRANQKWKNGEFTNEVKMQLDADWVNKMEKEVEVYDRLQESYRHNKQEIIDSAHSIEDYLTLERANLI